MDYWLLQSSTPPFLPNEWREWSNRLQIEWGKHVCLEFLFVSVYDLLNRCRTDSIVWLNVEKPWLLCCRDPFNRRGTTDILESKSMNECVEKDSDNLENDFSLLFSFLSSLGSIWMAMLWNTTQRKSSLWEVMHLGQDNRTECMCYIIAYNLYEMSYKREKTHIHWHFFQLYHLWRVYTRFVPKKPVHVHVDVSCVFMRFQAV